MPIPAIRVAAIAAVTAVLSLLQVAIGGDPLVVALADLGLFIGMGQYTFFGLDILSITPIIFMVRYYGLALVLKSLRLQTIQSDLFYPMPDYLLVIGIISAASVSTLILRMVNFRGLFPEPKRDAAMGRAAWIMFVLGMLGEIMNIGGVSHEGAASSGGALHQIGAALAPLYFGSVVVGATRALRASNGRHLFDRSVAIFVGVNIVASLAAGSREVVLDCVVSLLIVALVNGFRRPSYLVGGLVMLVVFSAFLSPVILYTRMYKTGTGAADFAAKTTSTALQAATSPGLLSDIHDRQKEQASEAARDTLHSGSGNYLGNGNNVENRLAWIGLVDNIYSVSKDSDRLGTQEFGTIWDVIKPSFIFKDKPTMRGTFSDTLNMRFGLEDPNAATGNAYNFGLPMEGYVSFGVIGLLLYPIVGLLLMVGAMGLFSSLRYNGVIALSLFCAYQHAIFENQSDGFLRTTIPIIPILGLIYYGCFYVAKRMEAREDGAAVQASRVRPPKTRSPYLVGGRVRR